MQLYRWFVALAALGLLCAFTDSAGADQFSLGDILVSDFNANHVQQFSPAGTLIRTFSGTGTECLGIVVTPAGNLFVACRNGSSPTHGSVLSFSPNGTQIGSFNTPQISNTGDMTLFPDGVLAITDYSDPLREYTQSGTFLRTVPVPGPYNTGATVAANDGTLWATGETDRKVYNFTETGTLLRSFSVPFEPSDVQVARDGSLWFGGLFDSHVYHYSANGAQLGSITTSFSSTEGIALSFDESMIYVTYEGATSIAKYSVTGTPLGSFTVPGANDLVYLTVVTPEPSVLGLISVVMLLHHRRRRRAAPR